MQNSPEHVPQLLDEIYRTESRPVFATLIRLLGDFDLAEDALHDAFKAALEQWTERGVPSNPRAWLVSTGRFKAIDRIRRQSKFDPLQVKQVPPDFRFIKRNTRLFLRQHIEVRRDHKLNFFPCPVFRHIGSGYCNIRKKF